MTLTREQILNEPAGRQVDAWVAEHIFGYRRSKYGEQTVYESPVYQAAENKMAVAHEVYSIRDAPGGREAVIAGKIPKSGWPNTLIDFYSTEIAAAWQIVTHLFTTEHNVTLACGVRTTMAAVLNKEAGIRSMVDAPTAPEAICKAALLSVLNL